MKKITCKKCGWFLINPRSIDCDCPQCGKSYIETKSTVTYEETSSI